MPTKTFTQDRSGAASVTRMFEGRYDRLIITVAGVAFLVSICCAFGALGEYSDSELMTFVGSLVPSIQLLSARTPFYQDAFSTLAVQWLFLPVYLILLCMFRRPWVLIWLPDEPAKRDLRRRAKGLAFAGVVFSMILFADAGVEIAPSFIRGTVWDPNWGPINRLPYHGRLGLAIAAFFSPIAQASIYWLIPMILTRYVISPFLPIRPHPDRG